MTLRVGFILSETKLKLAAVCLEVVENLVMDMEKKAVFDAMSDAIRPVLEEHETRMQRMIARVNPSNN